MPHIEWLEWRRKGIGGSDVSVICGINQYKPPIELWLEKTGQVPHEEAGEAAYWGTQLESVVRAEFTKRTGIEVFELGVILQHSEHEFMFANLDGLCNCPTHGKCVFEAKTASAYKLGEWEDGIPDEYMLQIQHYIAVTDSNGAYIAVLIGGNTFKWRFIPRDDDLISMLIQLESDFWECVQNNTPPPLDGSEATARFLGEKFPDSTPSRIALPATAEELIYQYAVANEKVKEFTEQRQLAENLLKEMLGENEIGDIGLHAVTWKSQSREQLDSKAIKVHHPRIYKKFARKSIYRRFAIKSAI
jgi:putative phage-type endonuclease